MAHTTGMRNAVADTLGRALAVVAAVATLYAAHVLADHTPHVYRADNGIAVVIGQCGPGVQLTDWSELSTFGVSCIS
jgi:hypothetical protein